jgi:chromosome segregation ATPase
MVRVQLAARTAELAILQEELLRLRVLSDESLSSHQQETAQLKIAFAAIESENSDLEVRCRGLQAVCDESALATDELKERYSSQVSVLDSQVAARREQHAKLAASHEEISRQLKSCRDELSEVLRKYNFFQAQAQVGQQLMATSFSRTIDELKSKLLVAETDRLRMVARCCEIETELHCQEKSTSELRTRLNELHQSSDSNRSAIALHVAKWESCLLEAGTVVHNMSDAHCASSAEAQSSVSEAMRLAYSADQQRMALESTLRAFRVCGSRMREIGWLWVRGR